MKKAYLEQCIRTLSGMIVTGGRTNTERDACELLKDARLKMTEAYEEEKRRQSHEEEKHGSN